MTLTLCPAWNTVELDRDDSREYAQRLAPGSHPIVNATVKHEVLMSMDHETGIVIVQDILVEVGVENDPDSNCVGVDLTWAKAGEARVRFVGEWGDVSDFVDADRLRQWADPWVDEECEREARSVLRSMCRD